MRWETKQSFDGKLCLKYLYQKLSKSDNWFSSYSQKRWGCFFETQCRKIQHSFKTNVQPRHVCLYSYLTRPYFKLCNRTIRAALQGSDREKIALETVAAKNITIYQRCDKLHV